MKKLALLVVATTVAFLVFHLWPDQPAADIPKPSTSATSAAAPTVVASAPTTPSPAATTEAKTEGPYSSTDAAKKAWEPVAQGFALAYPNTPRRSQRKWLDSLRPYLAQDVLDELHDTELAKVPAGHYAGYQVLKQADESLTVRVTYQEGWALILYMAAVNDRTWSVASFDVSEDFD